MQNHCINCTRHGEHANYDTRDNSSTRNLRPQPKGRPIRLTHDRGRQADLPLHHVHLHQGGAGLPVVEDRELLPLGTGLLPEGHTEGPRVQGAVRLRVQGLPQGGRGGTAPRLQQGQQVQGQLVPRPDRPLV